MDNHRLYSVLLELAATDNAVLPGTTGNLTHALFLEMIAQVDPALAQRLHDEPEYRPFTVSALLDAQVRDGQTHVQAGKLYRLRITLLDGGEIWECLSRRILEERKLTLRLGPATFLVERLLSTPSSDPAGRAAHTTWQELAGTPMSHTITLRFTSPTAFSLGERRFALFPEPILVWDSLLRTWNRYAPEALHIEKTDLREFVNDFVVVVDYTLRTTKLSFPRFSQIGFSGSCTYTIRERGGRLRKEDALCAVYLATLARFSLYAGVGYKTTMGMGQTHIEDGRGRGDR
jgi:CRISPR-associated endoribonuclease Cas6